MSLASIRSMPACCWVRVWSTPHHTRDVSKLLWQAHDFNSKTVEGWCLGLETVATHSKRFGDVGGVQTMDIGYVDNVTVNLSFIPFFKY